MERAGVDVVTDGEMRRESYSNRFATALDGVDLDEPGVALDRTGHENPVPRVVGPIRRTRPVEVRDVEFLRSLTDRRIKITVPGPFTMTQQAQNDHYADDRSLALAYAEAVNEELRDLKAAGADVVQIDEPYLQARPEPAREYALEAIDRALEGIEGETVLHTCFGYAHIVHDRPRGYPFLRRAERVRGHARLARGGAAGTRPRGAARAPDKTIVLGVLDLGSAEVETPEAVAAPDPPRARRVVPPERLVVAPDCGMKYLPRERAFRKLQAMVAGPRSSGRISASEAGPPHRQAYPDRVEVRGRDLTGDLMGTLSFTEYFHLLLTGREPTEEQRFFLDLLLVAIAEHGLMPTNVAARMTLAADPGSLQGAVAAGILGAGPVVLGTSEECARLLEQADEAEPARGRPRELACRRAAACRASAIRCTSRSTRAPSGSSSSRTSAASSGRARRARARVPRRRRGGLGQAADDERLHADRGSAPRPRLSGGGREGRPDPRAHGEPARAPGRGAAGADRLPAGARGRGGRRVRARNA